jgi:hypothetical protein
MDRYLMDYCVNYNLEFCQLEIKNARRAKEIINGKIPFFPIGKEQKELDEICGECTSRYFKIIERVCPVCHGEEFQKVISGAEILDDQDRLKVKITFMECKNCKSKLKLVEQF